MNKLLPVLLLAGCATTGTFSVVLFCPVDGSLLITELAPPSYIMVAGVQNQILEKDCPRCGRAYLTTNAVSFP